MNSQPNSSMEKNNSQEVQQIDFRNVLKNNVSTKTQDEYSTRAQNATQIDFRYSLKKKPNEVTQGIPEENSIQQSSKHNEAVQNGEKKTDLSEEFDLL